MAPLQQGKKKGSKGKQLLFLLMFHSVALVVSGQNVTEICFTLKWFTA